MFFSIPQRDRFVEQTWVPVGYFPQVALSGWDRRMLRCFPGQEAYGEALWAKIQVERHGSNVQISGALSRECGVWKPGRVKTVIKWDPLLGYPPGNQEHIPPDGKSRKIMTQKYLLGRDILPRFKNFRNDPIANQSPNLSNCVTGVSSFP